MSATPPSRRNPLVIHGNSLSSGERTTTFRRGSAEALLRSYLILVRDMRGQRREPSIELRADDVAVLASHLGVSQEIVLGGLLDLMGATRAQRSAMLAMLAAGALSVVLSGSIVTGLSDDGVSVEFERLADAVQAAVSGSGDESAGSSGAASEAVGEASVRATASESAGGAHAPRVAAQPTAPDEANGAERLSPTGRADDLASTTPSADVLRSVAAATASTETSAPDATDAASLDAASVDAASVDEAGAGEPTSIAVAPDGSLVASVAPPVPAAASEEPVAVGQLPDGTTVGVAAPPVPPPTDEPVATAELPDGTTVGVAAPPVPPAPQD